MPVECALFLACDPTNDIENTMLYASIIIGILWGLGGVMFNDIICHAKQTDKLSFVQTTSCFVFWPLHVAYSAIKAEVSAK